MFLTIYKNFRKDMNDKSIDVNYAIYIVWTTFHNGYSKKNRNKKNNYITNHNDTQ